jgi:hypothetical protein
MIRWCGQEPAPEFDDGGGEARALGSERVGPAAEAATQRRR